ncbi:hypothetical protein WJX81_006462 [Elliptochloris bilobata]|uniref:Pre-mRNA cleavage factor Im 25 kDa subunit n=1 Tax=Elliptochloris bilobata TaxID=381761 RepID=A0AAW1S6R1_9CHLO
MAAGTGQTAVTLYPVGNYNFGVKAPIIDKDATFEEALARMQQKYAREGARRSVEAVLLVHEHHHPHVLLLQVGSSFFKLPGGRLRPGENEVDGLKRKLTNKLAPEAAALKTDWEVGECLGTFWRPSFDLAMFPYLPAHCTRPKEVRKLFLVPLPEKCYFAVPKNLKLLAVPLFELYDNVARYGPLIAALPSFLSRLRFTLAGDPVQQPLPALPAPGAAETHREDMEEVYG